MSDIALSQLNLTWGEQSSDLPLKFTSEYPLPGWWRSGADPRTTHLSTHHGVVVMKDVITEDESICWLQAVKELGGFSSYDAVTDIGKLVLAESISCGIPVIWPHAEKIRTCSRFIWQVPKVVTDALWMRINQFIPDEISDDKGVYMKSGINRRFRFFKTDTAEEFQRHTDQPSARIAEDGTHERSFYTLVIWLNDEFTGGEIAFDGYEVKPVACGAIIFPQSQTFHAGLPVTSGCKYLIRSDIFYRFRPRQL